MTQPEAQKPPGHAPAAISASVAATRCPVRADQWPGHHLHGLQVPPMWHLQNKSSPGRSLSCICSVRQPTGGWLLSPLRLHPHQEARPTPTQCIGQLQCQPSESASHALASGSYCGRLGCTYKSRSAFRAGQAHWPGSVFPAGKQHLWQLVRVLKAQALRALRCHKLVQCH